MKRRTHKKYIMKKINKYYEKNEPKKKLKEQILRNYVTKLEKLKTMK